MTTFLVGLLASVPVSILANLMTPYFRDRVAKMSRNRRDKLRVRVVYELARRERYRVDRSAMAAFIALRILALIGLVFGFTILGIYVLIAHLESEGISRPYSVMIQALTFIGIFMVNLVVLQTATVCGEAINMEKYVSKLKARCTKLGIDYETVDKLARRHVDEF